MQQPWVSERQQQQALEWVMVVSWIVLSRQQQSKDCVPRPAGFSVAGSDVLLFLQQHITV
jgi:hypothetical protein